MSSPLVGPLTALKDIVRAMGLDEHRVVSIDIHADCVNLPTVTAIVRLDVEKNGRLCDVIKRYQMVERETTGESINFREYT